ncbi:MAG: hypothetical protein E7388_04895 [Ruminococcaceae bacterium]|nr:hypothetical protein [Oscillospiraceae bacterium]
MLIKTIVDKNHEGAVNLGCYETETEEGVSVSVELWIAEIDYDNTFVKNIAEEASKWCVHTTYIYDYESSTDAGNGRDDYFKEENDMEINIADCIVKDGEFSGVVCKAFERESFVLVTYPKKCIGHSGNYSGKGYHFYRTMDFELLRK